MKLTKTAKILITTGATLLTSALFFGRKTRASSLNQYTIPAQGTYQNGTTIITQHDTVYDYKYEKGRWYTRKKGATQWTDMQTALNPQDFQLAVSRLQKYVQH